MKRGQERRVENNVARQKLKGTLCIFELIFHMLALISVHYRTVLFLYWHNMSQKWAVKNVPTDNFT